MRRLDGNNIHAVEQPDFISFLLISPLIKFFLDDQLKNKNLSLCIFLNLMRIYICLYVRYAKHTHTHIYKSNFLKSGSNSNPFYISI